MFERTEIAESIYKGVVEPSYKKTTREYANYSGHSRKMRGEADSSNTYSEMSESASKCRKRYTEHPKDRLKTTCLIHVPEYSSDECNVLGYFDFKYAKTRPNMEYGQHSANRKEFNRQQENNYIVKLEADEIILQEDNKVSFEE